MNPSHRPVVVLLRDERRRDHLQAFHGSPQHLLSSCGTLLAANEIGDRLRIVIGTVTNPELRPVIEQSTTMVISVPPLEESEFLLIAAERGVAGDLAWPASATPT